MDNVFISMGGVMDDFFVLMDGDWFEVFGANHPHTGEFIWCCERAYCECDGTDHVCSFCR